MVSLKNHAEEDILIRVNKQLMMNSHMWRTASKRIIQVNTDRTFRNTDRIAQLPKLIRMMGRTAKRYRINKVNMYVYVGHIITDENNNEKLIYSRKTCNNKTIDGELCNGFIKHDEHEDQVCEKCGLMINTHIPSMLYGNRKKYDELKENDEIDYGKYTPSIKHRNESWDTLDFNEYLRDKDEGTEELKLRYLRIKTFENTLNNAKPAS